jgi:hypothetical protein
LDLVEARWGERFGEQAVQDLRASLGALFRRGDDGRPRISEGLVPPAGGRRSGDPVAATSPLGLVPAERTRTREMVAQTSAFIEDPAGRLPHFPMWDMNRGFGP